MDDTFSFETIYSNDYDNNYEHVTVMLEKNKNDKSFGIAISGGREGCEYRNGNTAIIISDVIHNSPADTLVMVGDILISINGTNVENVNHSFAVELLRSMKKTVYLLIKRKKQIMSKNVKDEKINYNLNSYNIIRDSDKIIKQDYQINNIKKNQFMEYETILNKDQNGYGLYFGNLIYIKDQIKDTPAYNANINLGDILININDYPIDKCRSTKEVLDIIKKSGHQVTLKFIRPNVEWLPEQLKGHLLKHSLNGIDDQKQQNVKKIISKKHKIKQYDKEDSEYSKLRMNDEYFKNELGKVINDRESSKSNNDTIPNKIQQRSHSVSRFEICEDEEKNYDKLSNIKISKTNINHNQTTIRRKDDDINKKKVLSRSQSINISNLNDKRRVKIKEIGQNLGLQILGGNKHGIYVSALMENSAAHNSGLMVGDQILSVNDIDFKNITREEAIMILLSLKNGQVIFDCCNKYKTFEKIRYQQGDEFYIRVNFDYLTPNNPRELLLRRGDLLLIRDTMYGGIIGSWSALKLGDDCQPIQGGIIPNQSRAEQLMMKLKLEENKKKEHKKILRIGKYSQNRINTKTQYQSQDKLDTISFKEDNDIQIPAYERVRKKIPDFKRPVIIIGVASDLFRTYLCTKHPDLFKSPQLYTNNSKGKKAIQLSQIRNIISENKHCVLDISEEGIRLLQHVNIPPIVILLKMADKKLASEFRIAALHMIGNGMKDIVSRREAKNIFRHGIKFNGKFPSLITCILEIMNQPVDEVYMELLNVIECRQKDEIYVGYENKDINDIDQYLLREPNYESEYTNSESITEDESLNYYRDEDSNVFRNNPNDFCEYKSSQISTNISQNQPSSINIPIKDQSRSIDIQYANDKEQNDQDAWQSNLSSYGMMKNSISTEKKDKSNLKLSLNTVLRIPIDNKGGLVESSSTKVSVYIPPGKIISNGNNKEIFFKVYVPTINDTGKNVVNNTLLIVCGPSGIKFSRPIEIRIPYSKNSIYKLEDSIKITPTYDSVQNEWKNLTLDYPGAAAASFQLSQNMTAILVERFD